MASDYLKIFLSASVNRDRLDVVEVNVDKLVRFKQCLEPGPNSHKEVMESVPLDIAYPQMYHSRRWL